jgi:hypothetical protein
VLPDVNVCFVFVWVAAKDAMSCRVAFERGKERQVHLLVVVGETTGSLLLVEDISIKQHRGMIRVTAPLVGSDVSNLTFFIY